jgi:hypothetical protein
MLVYLELEEQINIWRATSICGMCTAVSFFKESFTLDMHNAKPGLKEGMSQWLDTL